MATGEGGKMVVWKMEWSQFLGSHGSATRMIAEVCDRHSLAIMAAHHNAVACGSYEGSCELCEKETR